MAPRSFDDGGLEHDGVPVRPAGPRVEESHARTQAGLLLCRLRTGGHVEARLAPGQDRGDQGVLQVANDIPVLDHPHHVVPENQSAEQRVDVGHPAGHAVTAHL
jgi:hypothetical protein